MSGDRLRHWERVADGWAAWLAWTERNFRPVTDWLATAGVWPAGGRVLDVACGSGYPALEAARCVGPAGGVVATDFSPAMVAVTARAARAARLANVTCLEMDAEALRFEDAPFDAVTNVYGLMFSPDPARAIGEARRVLKPGGRFAVVTWDEPAVNPFFSVITTAAAPALSLAAPRAGAPGPFRFASHSELAALLRDGGFADVRVDSRAAVFECASADEYFALFSAVAWKARVDALSDEAVARLKADIASAARPYTTGGALHLTATSLCASGYRP